MTLTQAGLPEARARSRAGRMSLGSVTCSPWPPSAIDDAVVARGRQEVGDVAALLAVAGNLPIADLVPGRVVAHDADDRQVETHGRVELEAVEPKSAVAKQDERFLVRQRHLGGDGKGHAHAQRPQRPRVEPVPGLARLDDAGADRHHVAAVADEDGVLGQEIVDLPGQPQRMNRHGVGVKERQVFVQRLFLRGPEVLEPGSRCAPGCALPSAAASCPSTAAQSPVMPMSIAAIVAQLAVVKIDLDDLGVRGEALAVAQPEVERRAQDQDDVGVGQGFPARAAQRAAVLRAAERPWRSH